jgi:hypothetical protein
MRFSIVLFAGLLLWPAVAVDANHAAAAKPVRSCVCIPSTGAMQAAFNLAAVGRLGPGYPHLPRIGVDSAIVPPTLLKAVGWVESNWQQFDTKGVPLVSFDFSYGVMQATSGMAGAFGDPNGTISPAVQARIAGDYRYNIAFGARELAQDWGTTPAIGSRDPTALEDWYYALWAYNGWGYVNNPNNPAFSRQGTPATNPSSFPYQERVYYWVQHPPRDASGHPMWTPMHVTLPPSADIGSTPHSLRLAKQHREIPHVNGVTYDAPQGLTALRAGSATHVHIKLYNTGGLPWKTIAAGQGYTFTYHWVKPGQGTGYDAHLSGVDIANGKLIPIPGVVPVGGSAKVSLWLHTPNRAGNLALEWDVVGPKGVWFTHSGVPPGFQKVRVGWSVPAYHQPADSLPLQGNHARFVVATSAAVPSSLSSGQAFSETILLFNPGALAWGQAYRLRLPGARGTVPLPVHRVGKCQTVRLVLSGHAPNAAGTYHEVWRLQDPQGNAFGPPITIGFTVA